MPPSHGAAAARGDCVALDPRADRVEQGLAGRGEVAAHDHELRVQRVDEPGEDAADGVAGVADGARRSAVAGFDQLAQLLHRDALVRAPLEQRGDRDRARDGLEAAAVPAAADQPALVTRTWPISPATPPKPWYGRPSRTMPAPTPAESRT